jgi:hypothetical protein
MPRSPRKSSPRKSHRKVRGGRRTDEERLTAKCAGKTDPISMDEIPPEFAIRLTEGGVTECWDIRHLKEWFTRSGGRRNPLTNLSFSAASLAKIEKKFNKVFQLPSLPVETPFQIDLKDKQLLRKLKPRFFYNVILYKPGLDNESTEITLKRWSETDEVSPSGDAIDKKYEFVVTSGGLGYSQYISIFTKDMEAHDAWFEYLLSLYRDTDDNDIYSMFE